MYLGISHLFLCNYRLTLHHVALIFCMRSIGWALFGVNCRPLGWADIWYWVLFRETTVYVMSCRIKLSMLIFSFVNFSANMSPKYSKPGSKFTCNSTWPRPSSALVIAELWLCHQCTKLLGCNCFARLVWWNSLFLIISYTATHSDAPTFNSLQKVQDHSLSIPP